MKNTFLTGRPGVGKTTVIKEWVKKTRERAGGFFSEEIRDKSGERVGFKIISLDGREGVLAKISPKEKTRDAPRVGKYEVNIKDLEEIGVRSINEALADKEISLIVIDEVGKMELFSSAFKTAVLDALASDKKVIGVITQSPSPFVREIKSRSDCEIIEATKENRDNLKEFIF